MVNDKSQRRPLIDPFLLALKSRRVLVAIAALLVGMLTLALPEVAALRGEILTLVIALALALIGGYSLEDAAGVGRERATASPEALRELVKEVLAGLVDEVADNSSGDELSGAESPPEKW
jgi:hypothetical protein